MIDKYKKFFSATKNVAKRSTVAILCTVLASVFAIMSCDKLRRLDVGGIIEVITPTSKDVTFSTCKKMLKDNENADSSITITSQDNSLYITHKDINLNCGFEEINVTTLMIGNTIEVNIEENPRNLRCLCSVDISYSIGEFEEGTYVLIIKHLNQQIYSQTINF